MGRKAKIAVGEFTLETWNELGDDLLSKEGKRIVSEDPDLKEETIQRLRETEHPKKNKRVFYFNEANGRNIGLAALSMCIKANPYACMGELVARYSAMRKIPYIYTAEALNDLRKENDGFTVFTKTHHSKLVQANLWRPSVVNVKRVMPPKKRKGAVLCQNPS